MLRKLVTALLVALSFAAGFAISQNLERQKDSLEAVVKDTASQLDLGNFYFYDKIDFAKLGLSRDLTESSAVETLSANGFDILSERRVLCVFGESFGCNDDPVLEIVFTHDSNPDSYYLMVFRNRRTLTGCKPRPKSLVELSGNQFNA